MIFLDLFFPPKTTCLLCGEIIKEQFMICKNCEKKLKFIDERACKICGKPLEQYGICPDCENNRHIFDCNVSAFEYDEKMKELIARFKYYNERQLSDFFSYYMTESIKKRDWNIDVIIPVPLHKSKLNERGFNQSELIARNISYKLNVGMSKALRRLRDTPTQTVLNREYRINNVKDAFKALYFDAIKGKNILLIDDILTTGATLDECAKVLKDAGATKVYTATIATGRNV
ncbi:ComF family protein [Aceticella autotrophica]|uniref:ComF family protein n=1 Tax=Aceticella autotrophica TaxID=2755338 RepID=A0A975AWW8_9THEO|nr:ComF family protein [Aceticella autotrophica]QSZ27961.1 ComF family protein [Aceticella autotrophica]